MKKEISKEDVEIIPAFALAFKQVEYKKLFDSFLDYVNIGAKEEKPKVIGNLLKIACEYDGSQIWYKSIFLDLAWAVLENNRSLWTMEEKANGYSDIDLHWHFYPEYDGSFDDFESVILGLPTYFEVVLDLMVQVDFFYKTELCFALYVLFVQRK